MPPWHPAAIVATWFGVGLLPAAPGTWGSLAALPIGWAIFAVSGEAGLAAAAALVFAAGWPAASTTAQRSSINDPTAIVVDEVVGQWLTLLAAPFSLIGWGLAFLLFRLFDIWKPWPVRWLDRHVAGGFGIMLDDMAAAGYAALVLSILSAIRGSSGVHG